MDLKVETLNSPESVGGKVYYKDFGIKWCIFMEKGHGNVFISDRERIIDLTYIGKVDKNIYKNDYLEIEFFEGKIDGTMYMNFTLYKERLDKTINKYKEIKTLKEQWIPILYREYPHIAEEDKYLIDEYTEKALEEGIRDITIVMEWLECETGLIAESVKNL